MAADGVPMETMWPVALQWLSSVRGVYLRAMAVAVELGVDTWTVVR